MLLTGDANTLGSFNNQSHEFRKQGQAAQSEAIDRSVVGITSKN
jgi:hypothetical protein